MKKYDPVQEYLRGRGCPAHVVKAGLKGLVMSWEKVVAELVFDGYRFGLRDFVNDLDRREIVAGALERLAGVVPAAYSDRVLAADQRFEGATQPANRCLLDAAEERARGVSRDRQWWYYRFPRRYRANFAKDLADAHVAVQQTAAAGSLPEDASP